jgi:cytidyltransferase-like protein
MINLNLYKPLSNKITDRRGSIETCVEVFEILNKCGYKSWIDHGALLGAYREGKIIDHDHDVDILCIEPDNINIDVERPSFIRENERNFIGNGDRWRNIYNFQLLSCIQEKFYIRYYVPNAYMSLIPKDSSNFTLNHICIGIYSNDYETLGFPYFFIDELETIKLYDLEVPCPRHLDKFIPMRFGHNWNVIDKNFKYKYNGPNVSISPDTQRYSCLVSLVGDMFHIGHKNLLDRCFKLFDRVVVIIHRDPVIKKMKNVDLIDNLETRKFNVQTYLEGKEYELYESDDYILSNDIMDKFQVDFLVAGREDMNIIKSKYKVDDSRLHLVKRTENISSTILRNKRKHV